MTRTSDDLAWPAHTERLTLRPATVDDLEATWRFRRLEEVARWMSRHPRTLDEYRQQFERPDRLSKTLVVELDGVVVGDLMLAIEDAWAQAEVEEQAEGVQAELGWCLDPAYGGRGLATEAVSELVRLCFEELHLRRVTANCFADNDASWRLMERIGMRREAHLVQESLHRDQGWVDSFSYALLADEWRRSQERSGEH
jgi:RimJ/RimL family protein N-acetyltransferase